MLIWNSWLLLHTSFVLYLKEHCILRKKINWQYCTSNRFSTSLLMTSGVIHKTMRKAVMFIHLYNIQIGLIMINNKNNWVISDCHFYTPFCANICLKALLLHCSILSMLKGVIYTNYTHTNSHNPMLIASESYWWDYHATRCAGLVDYQEQGWNPDLLHT